MRLIWHLEESEKLSTDAKEAFMRVDSGASYGAVPTIVLAELVFIAEKRRTNLAPSQVIADLGTNPNFALIPFTLPVLEEMIRIPTLELHDRIIVATTLALGGRLVTADRDIRRSGYVDCIW